jgi:hypothetical protein
MFLTGTLFNIERSGEKATQFSLLTFYEKSIYQPSHSDISKISNNITATSQTSKPQT